MKSVKSEGDLFSDPKWLARGPLAWHLVGVGLDLGPGHVPFPNPYPGSRIFLVDRWRPAQSLELYPELGDAPFPEPDVMCDLAASSLNAFTDGSMDFVVASHLIEHLPNPLGLLEGVERVLRPGGNLVLLVPDRRRTFDRDRPPTPLDHVVSDYERDVQEVDDEHIAEFRLNVDKVDIYAMSEAERASDLASRRDKSIHVHCWGPDEFNAVLEYAIGQLGHAWDLVEAFVADELDPNGLEFGYVFRKSPVHLPAAERLSRFRECWTDAIEHRRRMVDSLKADGDRDLPAPRAQAQPVDSTAGGRPEPTRLQSVYRSIRERLG